MDLPDLPNWHALGVMLLTVVALFLFSRERIPIETTSILVLAVLAVSFTVFPFEVDGETLDADEFFLGFGNDALIAISALMMASYGLVRTGALAPIGRWTAALWNVSPNGAMLGMLVSTAIISAFMNNTPQVVMMIPILVSVAMRSGTSASKTLMPMTFSAQLGGILTPIGTSLNLLIIATAADLGVPRFQMFDFFVPGAIVAAVGVALPVAGRAAAASRSARPISRIRRRASSARCCTCPKGASPTASRSPKCSRKPTGA